MNTQCFVEQRSDERILNFVTRYCAECYREFSLGETLFYDMQEFRYLCDDCARLLAERMDDECEIVEEQEGGLFNIQ